MNQAWRLLSLCVAVVQSEADVKQKWKRPLPALLSKLGLLNGQKQIYRCIHFLERSPCFHEVDYVFSGR